MPPMLTPSPQTNSTSFEAAFGRMQWLADRMLLDDLVFRLVATKSNAWDGPEHFMFYKVQALVDQYRDLFTSKPGFKPNHVFELGIYDGGSTAFWYEVLQPSKLIAIDILDREDSPYFRNFIQTRGLHGRVQTHWNFDQADARRLRALAAEALNSSLDLVIDDCSHLYAPTRASFEALFPLLGTGGLYIIEDWSWSYMPERNQPQTPWLLEESLVRLVNEIVELTGHPATMGLVKQMTIYPGFVVVERGSGLLRNPLEFRLPTQAAPRKRWVENFQPRNARAVAHYVLRQLRQIVMPPDSWQKRAYRAVRHELRVRGIFRGRQADI